MRRKWTRTEKTLPDLTCSSFPLPAGMLKSSNIRSTEVHLGKRSRASRDETAGLPPPNLMEKPAGSSENIYCQSGRWEKAILGGLDLLALPGNLGISYSHIELPLIPKHPTSETTNKRIPNKPHTLNTSKKQHSPSLLSNHSVTTPLGNSKRGGQIRHPDPGDQL